MLGGMILDYFCQNSDHEISATIRTDEQQASLEEKYPNVDFIKFDAGADRLRDVFGLAEFDWVLNAIGVIKPYIKDEDSAQVKNAIAINALFPHILSSFFADTNTQIIQIATDCVYSGEVGSYAESSFHDAIDAYGKTKSLGEVNLPNFHNLRCSIIGPEFGRSTSLLAWFLSQKHGAEVGGYRNHQWNGVTTLHFSKICLAIINFNLRMPAMQHIIPRDRLNKHELLNSFAKNYKRNDIAINEIDAKVVVDRTLETVSKNLNIEIWQAAGYLSPPTIDEMVAEMAGYSMHSKYLPRNL